jgi:hypothetical protein
MRFGMIRCSRSITDTAIRSAAKAASMTAT